MDHEYSDFGGFTLQDTSVPPAVVSAPEVTDELHPEHQPLMAPAESSGAEQDDASMEPTPTGVEGLDADEIHVDKEEPVFEMFHPDKLDCSGCKKLREVLHHSEYRQVYFSVHEGSVPGTFGHAIFQTRFTIPSIPQRTALYFVALYDRTNEWVKCFIASVMAELQADHTGRLLDSFSSTSPSPPRSNDNTNVSSTLPNLSCNLRQILNASYTGPLSTAAAHTAPAMMTLAAPSSTTAGVNPGHEGNMPLPPAAAPTTTTNVVTSSSSTEHMDIKASEGGSPWIERRTS